MLGLHAENTRQDIDNTKLQQFQKTAHDRSNVAGISDGYEHGLGRHVPIVPLGDLEGVALLAKDAPSVLGVEQSYTIMVGQVFDDLHAVVEHSWNFEHSGTTAQGLGKLLGSDLALGQEHHRGQGSADICGIQSRCRRGVTSGGTDGQNTVPIMLGHEMAEIGEGAGHPPVLEGRRRILTIILEGHGLAHKTFQRGGRPGHGRIALAKVHDVTFGDDRRHKFIEAEYPA